MAASLTPHLIASLPEEQWPEAVRRFQRLPLLRELAQNDEMRGAFVRHAKSQPKRARGPLALAADTALQPGPLALAAYGVRHPECQGAPETWLLDAGRDRLGAAYALLTASEAPLHPVDDSVPAALALRLRLAATGDWADLAEEAGQNPSRWRLPLQLLWGLWPGDHEALFGALLRGSPASAALAAQCLAVNFSPDDLVEFVARSGLNAPDAHWLAFAEALSAMGEAGAARQVLRPRAMAAAKDLPPAWNPNEVNLSYELERSLLVAATEDFTLAHPVLTTAWNQLRHLRAAVAAHIGRLALASGDLVVALTAYQDAFDERPEELGHRLGLARTLIRLGRAPEALALLENVEDPAAQLVLAQAQAQAGQPDLAHGTLKALDIRQLGRADYLGEAAALLEQFGDHDAALVHLERAAQLAPTDGSRQLAAAKRLLDKDAPARAVEYATQAAALAPQSPEAREILGQALLGSRRPADAMPHFQAALNNDPDRISSALGLAEAALAAGQPAVTRDTARGLLLALDTTHQSHPECARLKGLTRTLLGQAYSALDDENAAFAEFQTASSLAPTVPEPWRAMARHYVRHGEEAQALATLEAGRQALAVLESPEAAPLLGDLAERYVAAKRPTEAILALREACAADPRASNVHRRLGELLRQQGSTAEAVEWLRKALQIRPGDSAALFELGQALESLEQADEAWAAYQQAALTRPPEPEPYLHLGRATLAQVAKGTASASPLQAIAALRASLERAEALPESEPIRAEAHGWLAQAQHLAGDPQGALDSYRHALHLAPTRTDWSLGLGQVCLELHRPEVAVAALHEAREHAPDDARVHAALAEAYSQSGLWPEARAAAEAALRLDPENANVVRLQAEAAAHLGDTAGALRAWQHAIELAPRDASLLIRHARCLLDVGREDEARAVFTRALTLAASDPRIHLDAGLAFLTLGETEEALTILSQAVALDPHTTATQAAYAKAAARSDKHEAAHAAYLHAAELDPGPGKALYLREAGESLWAMNRRAAAVAAWRRALAHDPQDDGLRTRLGLALLDQDEPREALDLLEPALRRSPRDAHLAREAARAALQLGQLSRAADLLQGAIDLNPGDADARFMLGQVREQQGQLEAALNLYRQAARVNPGDGRYLAATATALAGAGRTAEALGLMEQALETSPESGEVLRQAGELFLREGRQDDAVRSFAQWTAAQPGAAAAHLALAGALVRRAEAQRRAVSADMAAADEAASAEAHAAAVSALQQASALGADPLVVRSWLGRAKAAVGDPREAQQLLESVAASKSPAASALPLADLYLALGAALRLSGQPDRAREALQAALQLPDNAAQAYVELGLIDHGAGDHAAAAHNFRRAIAAAPELAPAHYHLARCLAEGPDPLEAAPVLQRALALQPNVPAWHHHLARLHLAQSETGDVTAAATALGHLQRAAELDPANPDYAADLARALARDGDLAAALKHFERATAARGNDASLWTEEGEAHLTLHDYASAARCYARALDLEPGSARALLGAARVSLAQGKLSEAAGRADAAVRAAPDDPEALTCLADVAVARGDLAAAEKQYAAAATRSARPASALLALGRLLARQQKFDKALATLEQAAAADPASDEVFAALGEVQAATGNHTQATKSFREATRIAPRRAAHLLRLGRACRAQGQLDQAIAHLMQARDLAPQDDEVLREIGLVFDQRKQFDRALEMYQQAIAAQPGHAPNYLRAGIALKNLKANVEAAAALERAVALDPHNLEATKQLAVVNAMLLVQNGTRIVMPAAGQ